MVDASAKMGILGDINAFSFAGDGSPYYSGASHYASKPVIAVLKVFSTVLAPEGFLIPTPSGAGTAIGSNGSSEVLSMASLHLIVPTICPFTLKVFRQAVMTVSLQSLLWRISRPFIRTSN